ncbi:MAG TPA: HGxxPAAW family protein [Candidatus Nanopelagicaceae bacterium]|nr:HGxxPAAW family protein [Candidatus Nanopelagicaceae bacterium]
MVSHEDNHGKTPAAWIAVAVILVGSVISSLAVLMANPVVFWIGIGVAVIGAISGLVLRGAGYGQESTARHIGGR